MNAARPISPEEYAKFRAELYQHDSELGRDVLKYQVALDNDPTLQPKVLTEKLARVQGYKDRVVGILNRAILAESYWKAAIGKVDAKFEAAKMSAAITPAVTAAKNSETREAMASVVAMKAVIDTLFKGTGAYEDQRAVLSTNHADAHAFYREVENIYENLQSAGMNLALQIKSVMISTKVFSGSEIGELSENEASLSVGRV
jgi:predicted ATP-binding protein involved in virulence